MTIFKRLLFSVFCVLSIVTWSGVARAELNSNCLKYNDCDMVVACQLAYAVDTAVSGIGVDFDKVIATTITGSSACTTNYPNLFKKNIDVQLTDSVRLIIDWQKVKGYLNNALPNSEDAELISMIVDVFGPDTEAQKVFFTDLATSYVAAWHKNNKTWLDDAFVLNFLGEGDNMNKYQNVIKELTGETVEEELGIDVDWDGVLDAIAEVMDRTMQKRVALVCENNRSWQWSIDAIGWIITAVAAVFTVYAGGAGGAAIATGRAALGAGLKAAAKGVAKVGGKTAAKRLARAGTRQLVKAAVDLGVKKKASSKFITNYAGKGLLKKGTKTFVKAVGQNLTKKWTRIAAAGALIWPIGSAVAKNSSSTASTIYSLVESGITKDYINCQDLDHNEGCYTVCGDSTYSSKYGMDDFLNAKIFKPMLNVSVCVNPTDYTLHEIDGNGQMGKLLVMDGNKWSDMKRKIQNDVAENSTSVHWGCDWNEDDVDMYVGMLVYDPDTLEPDTSAMIVDEFIRLDD